MRFTTLSVVVRPLTFVNVNHFFGFSHHRVIQSIFFPLFNNCSQTSYLRHISWLVRPKWGNHFTTRSNGSLIPPLPVTKGWVLYGACVDGNVTIDPPSREHHRRWLFRRADTQTIITSCYLPANSDNPTGVWRNNDDDGSWFLIVAMEAFHITLWSSYPMEEIGRSDCFSVAPHGSL